MCDICKHSQYVTHFIISDFSYGFHTSTTICKSLAFLRHSTIPKFAAQE